MLELDFAVVAGYVVDAGEDDDDFGLEVDDVRTEASEHLCRHLTRHTASDVVVGCEEFGTALSPDVGDRIAHENGNGVFLSFDGLGVGSRVGGVVDPVGCHLRECRCRCK